MISSHIVEAQMQRAIHFSAFLSLGLIIGFLLCAIAGASAMPETTDSVMACEDDGNGSVVLVKEKRFPGACPPSISLPQGSAPPPGAIQINPTGMVPDDAVCEFTSNSACSQQGLACLTDKTGKTDKTCKDTWNKETHQCMCQCRSK